MSAWRLARLGPQALCHDGFMAAEQDPGPRNPIKPGTVSAPDFPAGLSWLNTDVPLSIRQLRGKVVLLDFWTYCCINCMHVLDDLKRLERKYRDELVVIGVHSAKFDAEKDTERIRQAVLRLGIEHPVVNDRDMLVWQSYAIRAWPSLLLIDPRGKVFGSHSGEQVYDLFDRVIAQMIEHYDSLGELHRGPVETALEATQVPDSVLSFPGKVLADGDGDRLFIADTNHHRIVVASLGDGSVLDVIGSGTPGLVDGNARRASFFRPQGMARSGDSLFVADTGNHAIRLVDLSGGSVTTIAGDGQQDTEWVASPGPLDGRRLNSPWDLELAHGVLFVAMAGSHQIFGIDLEGGYIAVHAGSGREDHVDGPLMAAALAQPSGLTTDGECLFVADSEISSVRAVSLDPRGGHVRTVVGQGLFDFGDVDGVGADVRLQHPLDVAFVDGAIYVADTYNNKIKTISLPSCRAATLAGAGLPGYKDGPPDKARFNEPGGITHSRGTLYVADTNNHMIRTVDIETGTVSAWPLRDIAQLTPPAVETEELPGAVVRGGRVAVRVHVDLPEGYAFSPDADSGIAIRCGQRTFPAALRNGVAESVIDLASDQMLRIETVAYYCSGHSAACHYYRVVTVLPIRVEPAGKSEVEVRLHPLAR